MTIVEDPVNYIATKIRNTPLYTKSLITQLLKLCMCGERCPIEYVKAREILDSRGNPTIEVDVKTCCGFGRAAIPSGASTGAHEAVELRDGDKRYGGKGVMKAVENVNKIIGPKVVGMDVCAQRELDNFMKKLDGTPNKSKLGANAILGVSLAAARAAANGLGIPLYQYIGGRKVATLPAPMMNVINGGKHAGGNLKIQEFMIFPLNAPNFREALRMGTEVYHSLKSILKKKYGVSAINLGDEGGFAPPLDTTTQALDCLVQAIEGAGYKAGKDVWLGLDAAASEFFDEKAGKYDIDSKKLSPQEMVDYYANLTKTYPLFTIEDPFFEDAFGTFAELTKKVGSKVQVVGDDLLVTNVERIKTAIKQGSCNALLLKLNQIGTISESIDSCNLSLRNGWRVVVSHRSGETEDSSIADLVVGFGAHEIKTGAPARTERVCKYNQLLRIEEELGEAAEYWGPKLV